MLLRIKKRMYLCWLFLAIMVVSLAGCANTKKEVRKGEDYQKLLRKEITGSAVKTRDDASKTIPSVESNPEASSDLHEWSGDASFRKGHLEMAFVDYNKALRLDPNNLRVKYKRGLLFLAGGMTNEAIEEFEKILEEDPEYALAHMGLGQVFFQRKQYHEAERHFEQSLQLDSTLWKSCNFLGVIYDYKGRHGKAVDAYQAAIALVPNKSVLLNNLGTSYYLAGEYEDAINSFMKALEAPSPESKVYNNLGLALAKKEKIHEAFDAFRRGGDRAQAYNNIGCVYLWFGNRVQAKRAFERAIEERPEFYEKANENLTNCMLGGTASFDMSVTSSSGGTSLLP